MAQSGVTVIGTVAAFLPDRTLSLGAEVITRPLYRTWAKARSYRNSNRRYRKPVSQGNLDPGENGGASKLRKRTL